MTSRLLGDTTVSADKMYWTSISLHCEHSILYPMFQLLKHGRILIISAVFIAPKSTLHLFVIYGSDMVAITFSQKNVESIVFNKLRAPFMCVCDRERGRECGHVTDRQAGRQ
jgi:hypothetical protein